MDERKTPSAEVNDPRPAATPALDRLRLSPEERQSLDRQGFVAQEKRSEGRPYYKLRFRCQGRQRVRYLGQDPKRAAAVRRDLDRLHQTQRLGQQLRRGGRQALAALRNVKTASRACLEDRGLAYHGFALRRPRCPPRGGPPAGESVAEPAGLPFDLRANPDREPKLYPQSRFLRRFPMPNRDSMPQNSLPPDRWRVSVLDPLATPSSDLGRPQEDLRLVSEDPVPLDAACSQRIQEYVRDSLAREDPLDACRGAMNGTLMRTALNLGALATQSLTGEGTEGEHLRDSLRVVDTLAKVNRQIDRYARVQREIRGADHAARAAEHLLNRLSRQMRREEDSV